MSTPLLSESTCGLTHRRQKLATGCTAHALFAITHHEKFLEYQHETSSHRLQIIAFQEGVFLNTLWVDHQARREMPLETWNELAEWIESPIGLHVVIRVGGLLHSVAVQLNPSWEAGVWVSDSLREGPKHFTRDEFSASVYASALLVQAVMDADLKSYRR